jgi:hypothetical protein
MNLIEIVQFIVSEICLNPIFLIVIVPAIFIIFFIFTLKPATDRAQAARKSGKASWKPMLVSFTSPLGVIFAIILLLLSYLIAPALYVLLAVGIILAIPIVFVILVVRHWNEIVDYILKKIGPWGERMLSFIETAPQRMINRVQNAWGRAKVGLVLWFTRHPHPKLLIDPTVRSGLSWIGLSSEALLEQIAHDPYSQTAHPVEVIHALGHLKAYQNLTSLGMDTHTSLSIRSMAANELEYLGATQEAASIWIAIGNDANNSSPQLEAADHLYKLGRLSEARDLLKRILDTPDLEPRWSEKAQLLQRKVDQSPSLDIKLPDPKTAHTDPMDQLQTTEILLKANQNAEAAQSLVSIATSPEQNLRIRQHAIQRMKTYHLTEALNQTLTHPDLSPDLRYQVIQAIVQEGNKLLGVQEFRKMAKDDSISLRDRTMAAHALVKIDASDDTRVLLNSLASYPQQEPDLRLMIAQALLEAGWKDNTSRVLVDLIRDPTTDQKTRDLATRDLTRLHSL